MASKKGYNYAFKLFMEGVNIPFKGATISCTPGGVVANINVYSNKELLDLKPKTAIQIFYREWNHKGKDAPWRLMFDGFFSSFYKTDQATEGRGIGLICRDFRMDIRRAPAALAWEKAQDLTTRNFYNSMGIFETFVIKGVTKRRGKDIRIFGNTGLNPLSYALQLIAGSAGFNRNPLAMKKTKKSTNVKPEPETVPISPIEYMDKTGLGDEYWKKYYKVHVPEVPFEHRDKTGLPEGFWKEHLTRKTPDSTLSEQMRKIKEENEANRKQKDGESAYTAEFGGATLTDKKGIANCGFYLDAIIRGMWTEAVGGTAVGTFLNKRIRIDKRFLVPVNKSGYNFWNRQKASVHIGSHLMGNARFSSLEAAIMRLAGAFSTKVYTCATPSLIPIGNDIEGKPMPAVKYVIDEGVRNFLVNRVSAEFGGKYILNETMLLPPLEFTAPPNCNLLFPPMYDRAEWRYDIDADVTRGYFAQTNLLSTPGNKSPLHSPSIQVPNALFNIQKEVKAIPGAKELAGLKKEKARLEMLLSQETGATRVLEAQFLEVSEKVAAKELEVAKARTKQSKHFDQYGRRKPPLTLEERYKGISVVFGNVSYELAANDAAKGLMKFSANAKARARITGEIAELKEKRDELQVPLSRELGATKVLEAQFLEVSKKIAEKKAARDKIKAADEGAQSNITNALKHHAILKFFNRKYAGRILTVDMAFNPYIMAGFPGAVIADDLGYGEKSMKSLIGMVQQVKHTIFITPAQAEANTSVVLNNVRFEDEPTDMDKWGSPLYMEATNQKNAEIDIKTLEYKDKKYYIPEPKAPIKKVLNSKYYDLADERKLHPTYIYAKDLLSLTKRDIEKSKRNQIYIDERYEPTRIARFYRDVFGNKTDHFMIGSLIVDKKKTYFMYNTIHEALAELRVNNEELLNNYDACLSFVKRNICSADAFFQGILGLSIKIGEEYKNIEQNFDDSRIEDEYYGVTTEDYKGGNLNGLKKENKGMMTGPGQFSSIREHMPVTALIQERRNIVKKYEAIAKQRVSGTQYSPTY